MRERRDNDCDNDSQTVSFTSKMDVGLTYSPSVYSVNPGAEGLGPPIN